MAKKLEIKHGPGYNVDADVAPFRSVRPDNADNSRDIIVNNIASASAQATDLIRTLKAAAKAASVLTSTGKTCLSDEMMQVIDAKTRRDAKYVEDTSSSISDLASHARRRAYAAVDETCHRVDSIVNTTIRLARAASVNQVSRVEEYATAAIKVITHEFRIALVAAYAMSEQSAIQALLNDVKAKLDSFTAPTLSPNSGQFVTNAEYVRLVDKRFFAKLSEFMDNAALFTSEAGVSGDRVALLVQTLLDARISCLRDKSSAEELPDVATEDVESWFDELTFGHWHRADGLMRTLKAEVNERVQDGVLEHRLPKTHKTPVKKAARAPLKVVRDEDYDDEEEDCDDEE